MKRTIPMVLMLAACGSSQTAVAIEASENESGIQRRTVAPTIDGRAVRAGISYGPYREGQSPTGVQPSEAEILEDLEIIAQHWNMIRVYNSLRVTETILRLIRDRRLPIRVMLGAWVAADEAPEAEIEAAIRLANAYPEVVFSVCVGNETQVYWSGHRSSRDRLVSLIRQVRAAVPQPVTTADDYNFWNKNESIEVASEVDFIVLHAYAMWNRQQLEEAVAWTAEQVDAIRQMHSDIPVFMGETGWATAMHPSGDAARQIIAPAGEAEQAVFYREFTEWAREAELPYFYFEAFDEPWKGGPHPDEVEKHWGLFNVDRSPKEAMQDALTSTSTAS